MGKASGELWEDALSAFWMKIKNNGREGIEDSVGNKVVEKII